MPESNETNIATLTANYNNLDKSITALMAEVRAGNLASTTQNTQIIKDIAVLNSKQDDNSRYQERCDEERQDLDRRVAQNTSDIEKLKSQDLDERVTKNTIALTRLTAKSAAVAGVVSLAVGYYIQIKFH